jgi:dsRNA-specific ribonuclease
MGFFSEGKGKTIKLAELDAAKNILKIIREKKY